MKKSFIKSDNPEKVLISSSVLTIQRFVPCKFGELFCDDILFFSNLFLGIDEFFLDLTEFRFKCELLVLRSMMILTNSCSDSILILHKALEYKYRGV